MTHKTAPKLAIALQVCPLDVWLGQRLVRLLCSIEAPREDIEFIVSARRGTNVPAVKQIAEIAEEKFGRVTIIQGKRFGEGWPLGCNDLWQETMMRMAQLRAAGSIRSTGVLTFESDCIPLRPDWLDALAQAWGEAHAAGKLCLGHAHAPDGEFTHINGNAIFATDAIDRRPELDGSDANAGWDVCHGKMLLAEGLDTPLIFQRYRIKAITRKEVEAIRKADQIPALFHGIKGTDGMDAVEAMIADRTFFARP